MAGVTNTVDARIRLKYDTYDNWMASSLILKPGEVAIAKFENSSSINPSNSQYTTTDAIGIKVGTGNKYFSQLPWLQGIAADVYNWAKQSSKPSYTAEEISGLDNYINERLPSGGGSTTVASRIYQLVQGTNNNSNKYYLQYKDSEEGSQWIVDTSHYIDLADLAFIKNWLNGTNNDLSEYGDLTGKIAEQVLLIFELLSNDDESVEHQFVTQVTQSNGQIQVFRDRPTFEDINGNASVSQGGTGLTSIPQGEVMVGNGPNVITTVPIASEITNNSHLVPNYLIKQYVDNVTRGVTGAMHFIGEATVNIRNNSSVNPQIIGYNFTRAQAGDVILYEEKEFVWNGYSWQLLGDEGSYAVKGSIVNNDISDEANISQDKIYGLEEALDGKVDKEEDKQLSTNDYTDEDQSKLNEIYNGHWENIIEHITVNDNEIYPDSDKNITLSIPVLTQDQIDLINTWRPNPIEHIFINGTEVEPQTYNNLEKSINIQYVLTAAEKAKLTGIETGAQVNKLESLIINGTTYTPDQQNKSISFSLSSGLQGAQYPSGANTYTDITITNNKLELSKIAATGNISDILQSSDTYITFDCGTSTEVMS